MKIWKIRGFFNVKKIYFAESYIFLFLFVSVFAIFIANDKPLIRICDGSISFPFLSKSLTKEKSPPENDCFIMHTLMPYSPDKSDYLNTDFAGPFDQQWSVDGNGQISEIPLRNRHWLGTNMRGNDLAAQIVYGTRISLMVSLLSTVLSFLIGGLLGFAAGWYGPGKNRIKVYWLMAGGLLLFSLLLFNMNLLTPKDRIIGNVILSGLLLIFIMIAAKIRSSHFYKYAVFFSADYVIQRFSEIFSAIPRIILILALVSLLEPSFNIVVFILSITGWVDISRLLRSEIQRIKHEGFIEAAKVSGMGGLRIFIGQMLPNIWPSMLVILLYTFAGNIAAEASLSFLGVGLPADVVSLGSLVASGKVYFEAWWLVVFPGVWISGFIYSLFSLSRKMRNKYEIRNI
ncbi:MAG: ABC transporter permease [Bacteroidetes bacterium]|nr:ABC transporter permease [Bacteroidota bacterium]